MLPVLGKMTTDSSLIADLSQRLHLVVNHFAWFCSWMSGLLGQLRIGTDVELPQSAEHLPTRPAPAPRRQAGERGESAGPSSPGLETNVATGERQNYEDACQHGEDQPRSELCSNDSRKDQDSNGMSLVQFSARTHVDISLPSKGVVVLVDRPLPL